MDYIPWLRTMVGSQRILIPSVSALIRDESWRVLLCRQVDRSSWGLVGGAVEPGETPAAAVRREAREETGLEVRPTRVVGVYGGPDFFVSYPNGDEVAYVSTAFECEAVGGELRADGVEIAEVGFFDRTVLESGILNRIASVVLPTLFDGVTDVVFPE